MQRLVPEDFTVPEKLITKDFVVRKLTRKDAPLDYQAVMSSVDTIKKLRGGAWPTSEVTLQEDYNDLVQHEQEFANRTSFAYTVMNLTEDTCLGCVYFYPPRHPFNDAYGSDNENADVIINMWVTTDAYNSGLYPKLWHAVEKWLSDKWLFKKPYFSNPVKP